MARLRAFDRRWAVCTVGVLVTVLLLLVAELRYWQRIELAGYDLLTVLTTTDTPLNEVVIVGIDEPSFAELGRWPWPRSVHADLVESLKDAGAAAIAFDVLFADQGEPQDDRLFSQALQAAGNVALASDTVYRDTGQYEQLIRIEPYLPFRVAAAAVGDTGMVLDDDLRIRRFPADRHPLWAATLQAAGEAVPPLPGDALIRHYGPAYTLRYVSYYQALDPKQFLPSGLFEGRYVLVGLDLKSSPETGRSADDRYATPYLFSSEGLTPGVELHASLLLNALHGDYVRPLPYFLRLLLLVAAVAAGSAAFRNWHPWRSSLLLVALVAASAIAALAGFAAGYWWPVALPLSGVVLHYLVYAALAYVEERRRKLQLKQSFSRYVSAAVVDRIAAHPESFALGGERRRLTILFADLVDFTAQAEQRSPEEVAEFLNRYLTEQTRIVHRHQGTIDKFIGDAVMAFWGAPLEIDAPAESALAAAREMLEAQQRLAEVYRELGWGRVAVRIGINSGEVVLGNLGSEERFDYTAVGDNVNLASRLEGVNKLYGTQLLFSGSTKSELRADPGIRFVDRVQVKGRQEAVDLYTLVPPGFPVALQERAVAAYRSGDWPAARSAWQALLAQVPEDRVAAVYLERIDLLERRPPSSWDGVFPLEKM